MWTWWQNLTGTQQFLWLMVCVIYIHSSIFIWNKVIKSCSFITWLVIFRKKKKSQNWLTMDLKVAFWTNSESFFFLIVSFYVSSWSFSIWTAWMKRSRKIIWGMFLLKHHTIYLFIIFMWFFQQNSSFRLCYAGKCNGSSKNPYTAKDKSSKALSPKSRWYKSSEDYLFTEP